MKTLRGAELARATLEHIERLQAKDDAGERTCEHWNQSDWGFYASEDPYLCGTSMCFAGWACVLGGEAVIQLTPGAPYSLMGIAAVDNGYSAISKRAAELLELPRRTIDTSVGTYEEADQRLFAGDNDLEALRFYVQALEDGTYGQQTAPSMEGTDEDEDE